MVEVRCLRLYVENFTLYFASVESDWLQHVSNIVDVVNLSIVDL